MHEQYTSDFVVGAVVVLRQIGVLTTEFDMNHSRYHLSITPKSLLAIYRENQNKKHKASDSQETSKISVIKLQDFTVENLLRTIQEAEEQSKVQQSSVSRPNVNVINQSFVRTPSKANIHHINFINCASKENLSKTCRNSVVSNVSNLSSPRLVVSSPINTLSRPNPLVNNSSVMETPMKTIHSLGITSLTSNHCQTNGTPQKKKFCFKAVKNNVQSQLQPKVDEVPVVEESQCDKNCTNDLNLSGNLSCTPLVIDEANSERKDMLESVFDGVDVDSFFADF